MLGSRKGKGIRVKDLDWFINIVNTGTCKIPEIQNQYAKAKDELEVIEYKSNVKTLIR